jgi:hypothetical protein
VAWYGVRSFGKRNGREKTKEKRGENLGAARRTMRCSAYRISEVAISCVRSFVGPMVETSVGMLFASLAISDTKSVGTQERASGESGVSCSFFSSKVSATTFSISAGDKPARY